MMRDRRNLLTRCFSYVAAATAQYTSHIFMWWLCIDAAFKQRQPSRTPGKTGETEGAKGEQRIRRVGRPRPGTQQEGNNNIRMAPVEWPASLQIDERLLMSLSRGELKAS